MVVHCIEKTRIMYKVLQQSASFSLLMIVSYFQCCSIFKKCKYKKRKYVLIICIADDFIYCYNLRTDPGPSVKSVG
jgi:hypothetical protein